MVNLGTLGALVALLAGGACAAEPDWRPAGGDIFAIAAPAAAPGPEEAGPPQLAPAAQPLQAAVEDAAARHRLDPKLLHALVAVESSYQARAISPVGAGGLTQLMPATARELGVADRFDPVSNLTGGADYLARQLLRFGDVRLALAAYNAGPERVARLGRVPNFPETQAYVAAVVDCYLALSAGRSIRKRGDCRRADP